MTIYQNLPDAEIQMLISAYETKLRKIVQPLQRFETGLELSRYKDDNGLKQCFLVNFKNWMNDHNYRVSKGSSDSLTNIVYTRKFRHPDIYREWYLTEIRAKYNDYYFKVTMLAQFVGYDYSHLVGQLNFTKEEQASMESFREKNARGPVAADGWEGY
jgi:hypothetical protein